MREISLLYIGIILDKIIDFLSENDKRLVAKKLGHLCIHQ